MRTPMGSGARGHSATSARPDSRALRLPGLPRQGRAKEQIRSENRTEWHAGLASEMHDDATGNVLAAVRKAPIELEGFEQNGETEPSGTRLVGEQFTLVGSQRPVLGKFIRVPVLLHRILAV
jgi:hypothetical protein